MTPLLAFLLFTIAVPTAPLFQSGPQPPQVSVATDGTLSVYYPENRQLLIYEKIAVAVEAAEAELAIRKAELEVELAGVTGRPGARTEAMAKLSAARKNALDRPAVDQAYTCTSRYDIPSSPVATLKRLPCP